MDRRGFLRMMVGGVAAGVAVRTWPFRVYSFPTNIEVGEYTTGFYPYLAGEYSGILIRDKIMMDYVKSLFEYQYELDKKFFDIIRGEPITVEEANKSSFGLKIPLSAKITGSSFAAYPKPK